MLAFPMLEATKWRLQPLLAAINLKPPALPGDTYSKFSTPDNANVLIANLKAIRDPFPEYEISHRALSKYKWNAFKQKNLCDDVEIVHCQ